MRWSFVLNQVSFGPLGQVKLNTSFALFQSHLLIESQRSAARVNFDVVEDERLNVPLALDSWVYFQLNKCCVTK